MSFEQAVEQVKMLKETPSDNEMLELYGYFKQATVGDCNTAKPGFLDFKGKAKWESWNSKKGTDTETAKTLYVKLVNKLIENIGLKE